MCTALAIITGFIVAIGMGIFGYIYSDLHGRIH
jgi:hypothetical protein